MKILILEKNREPLQKVKVSGGGRCNLTHFCFKASELIKNYPRGREFLLKPFENFGPNETIEWFRKRGIGIKKEADGRMFPASNTSQTILDCFQDEVSRLNIKVETSQKVLHFEKRDDLWELELQNGNILKSKSILLATGSDKTIWSILSEMGLKTIPPVPSLFTFKIDDKELHALAGTSFQNAEAGIDGFSISGPALITHWGLSGPAILKLSAFAARELAEKQYKFKLKMDWLPEVSKTDVLAELKENQAENPKKKLRSMVLFGFSKRFWEHLCNRSNVSEYQNWSETGKKHFKLLVENIKQMPFDVNGKSTFKEEFVTAGGLDLSEIDPITFGVKSQKGLYVAGEALNIDAVTGGFNFQAAWTGAWHVAKALSAA